jgi:hypothetical protein
MRFLERELNRVSERLQAVPLAVEEHRQLYAVQQALSWALDTQTFKAPYEMISDTPTDSEGCPAGNGHSPFSDTRDRRAS